MKGKWTVCAMNKIDETYKLKTINVVLVVGILFLCLDVRVIWLLVSVTIQRVMWMNYENIVCFFLNQSTVHAICYCCCCRRTCCQSDAKYINQNQNTIVQYYDWKIKFQFIRGNKLKWWINTNTSLTNAL